MGDTFLLAQQVDVIVQAGVFAVGKLLEIRIGIAVETHGTAR